VPVCWLSSDPPKSGVRTSTRTPGIARRSASIVFAKCVAPPSVRSSRATEVTTTYRRLSSAHTPGTPHGPGVAPPTEVARHTGPQTPPNRQNTHCGALPMDTLLFPPRTASQSGLSSSTCQCTAASIGVSAAFGLKYSIYGVAWRRIAKDLDRAKLTALTSHVKLDDVPRIGNEIDQRRHVLGRPIARHQLVFGLRRRGRITNDPDDLVDIGHRDR